MADILNLVAPLFGLMILGYIAGKIANIPLEGLAWLNFFVIYIALPSMFFKLLSQSDFSGLVTLRFVVTTTLVTFAVFCLALAIALLRNRQNHERVNLGEGAIQGFGAAYGNVGYMGPPLALAALGPAAIAPAALIFSFDNALHFILAPMLMAINNRRNETSPPPLGRIVANIAWKIVSHPFILATLAGFAAAGLHFYPPAPLSTIIDALAVSAAPCALFMMGVTAALRPLRKVPPELTWLVPIKLVLHPLLVYFLLDLVGGFPPIFVQCAVLMAALPTAANVYVIAEQYSQWQERASSMVMVSTLVSILTLPAILYFLKNGFLPG